MEWSIGPFFVMLHLFSPLFIIFLWPLSRVLPYLRICLFLCRVVFLFNFHTFILAKINNVLPSLILLLRTLLNTLAILLLIFHLDLFLILLIFGLIPISLFFIRYSFLSLTRCILSFDNLWIFIGLKLLLLLITILLHPQFMVLLALLP